MALSPSGFSEGLKKSARVPLESSLISLLKPKMLPKMKHVVIVNRKLLTPPNIYTVNAV
jgi:hypothetical protein